MRTLLSDRELTYQGTELRPGWLAEAFGVAGEAVVAWLGPCHVPTKNLVDLEDAAAGAEIHAARMLHFLAEHPGETLWAGVLRQRLLVALAADLLQEQGAAGVRRRGDDLYVGKRKLSVSIATTGGGSVLIHLALNVDPAGAPVPTVGLGELGCDPLRVAQLLLERYAAEMHSVHAACGKVREVH